MEEKIKKKFGSIEEDKKVIGDTYRDNIRDYLEIENNKWIGTHQSNFGYYVGGSFYNNSL